MRRMFRGARSIYLRLGTAGLVVGVSLLVVAVASSPSGNAQRRNSEPRGAASSPLIRSPKSFISTDTKATCVYVGSSHWAQQLSLIERATGIDYNCIETFSNSDPTWTEWEQPWVTNSYGFAQWLTADPVHRTIILTQQLIPDSECTAVCSNPLSWEKACDAGAYNSHATALATELVASGFGSAVIRLGAEMNGSWENDYAGSTAQEHRAWAECFAQEVAAMRAVPGGHLLFDWNVNACVDDYSLASLYPGNAAVDFVGIDAYDVTCQGAPPVTGSAASFAQLAAQPDGLDAVTAFAEAHGKSMTIPEWGTTNSGGGGAGDDGAYVAGIGKYVATHDVAFESYFDSAGDGIRDTSWSNPNTLAAYVAAFG